MGRPPIRIDVLFPCTPRELLRGESRPIDASLWNLLDGVRDSDESILDYLDPSQTDDALIRGIGLEGGQLRIAWHAERLFARFSFSAPRRLSSDEAAALERICHGQWWDGIGENFEVREGKRGALAHVHVFIDPGTPGERGTVRQT